MFFSSRKLSLAFCCILFFSSSTFGAFIQDIFEEQSLALFEKKGINVRKAFDHFDTKIEIFRLLDSVQVSSKKPKSIISENEWDELRVDDMLAALDRTQTVFGAWGLKKMIIPTADVAVVESMQDRTTYLKNNHELYDELHVLIEEVADYEDALINYYNPHYKMHDNAKKLYYSSWLPGSKTFNASKGALDISFSVECAKLLTFLSAFALLNELPDIFVGGQTVSNGLFSNVKELITTPFRNHNISHLLLKERDKKGNLFRLDRCLGNKEKGIEPDKAERKYVIDKGSLGDRWTLWSAVSREWIGDSKWFWWLEKPVAGFCTVLQTAASDAIILFALKSSYDKAKSIWGTMESLKKQVRQVANLSQTLDDISFVINCHKCLADWDELAPLQTIIDSRDSSDKLNQLLELLNNASTFDGGGLKHIYSRGNVLLAHSLLREVKEELIPVLQSVAYLDAQLSVVDLFKEYENTDTPFCFAEFVDTDYASIELDDFWLPLTYSDSIITNSLCMGADTPNKIILTGPNGGGKSTVLKACCHAVLLGQSLGIVPAKKAKFSRFTGLKTTLNPQEDLSKGLSTFMAEKKRMQEIQAFIDGASVHDRYLIAADELYRGTIEKESAKSVCQFGKNIAGYKHIGLMIATHLEKPTELEKETGTFANYQMEHAQTRAGDLKRTFKLIPGAAHWWFDDEAMREAFIDSL